MIGKRVLVSQSNKDIWIGQVVDIESEEVFIVANKHGKSYQVDIFDIRSADEKEKA
jgi:hypothetical protein|tara:strand:- start:502 stop:669 length:168 start_codon:yes stop_codon:yes gene_type:complete